MIKKHNVSRQIIKVFGGRLFPWGIYHTLQTPPEYHCFPKRFYPPRATANEKKEIRPYNNRLIKKVNYSSTVYCIIDEWINQKQINFCNVWWASWKRLCRTVLQHAVYIHAFVLRSWYILKALPYVDIENQGNPKSHKINELHKIYAYPQKWPMIS